MSEYYKNVEASGDKYRVRLKLGMHQAYTLTVETAQQAAIDGDYLRAWLRATLPDCLTEKWEAQVCAVSTPPRLQDEKYRALMSSIPKSGTWTEQIKSAPDWVAKFVSRIMSTEEISATQDFRNE